MDVLFDMETADPDDFLTLCFLLSHPRVNLRAVTVTPGGRRQVGLVKTVLDRIGVDIPIGARTPDHEKNAVAKFYDKVLEYIPEVEAHDVGWKVILEAIHKYSDLHVITGAPLTNLHNVFHNTNANLKRWVAQGGFAGDNVVPKKFRLKKFDGMLTCPTFNFNGNPGAAHQLLHTSRIGERILVSKNVCHGMVYDQELHEKYNEVRNLTEGTRLIYKAMDIYLKKRPNGKKLHDPLAACTAINPHICYLKEVELYREKGKWGAKLKEGTRTWISIHADKELFHKTFMCQE